MAKTLQDADREANKLVANWTTGAALTGWIPGSAFFLTAADTAMIHQVASAYEVSAFDMDHLTGTLARRRRQRHCRRGHRRSRRRHTAGGLGGKERGHGRPSQSDRGRGDQILPRTLRLAGRQSPHPRWKRLMKARAKPRPNRKPKLLSKKTKTERHPHNPQIEFVPSPLMR